MIELSAAEFEKRIESHLRFDTCPHCGGTVDLIISAPMYGRTGARVVCRVCKTQTEYKAINDHFFAKKPELWEHRSHRTALCAVSKTQSTRGTAVLSSE